MTNKESANILKRFRRDTGLRTNDMMKLFDCSYAMCSVFNTGKHIPNVIQRAKAWERFLVYVKDDVKVATPTIIEKYKNYFLL